MPATFDALTLDDMVNRCRQLAPWLREQAFAAEDNRQLSAETEQRLHELGLFRFMQPRKIGGAELDYVSLIDIGEALAYGDASVAWNVTNLGVHHWMLAMFSPMAQDAVWRNDPDALIASSFVFPAGKAERIEGGYRLSGRWPFCSGVNTSTWNMLAGTVAPDSAVDRPELRYFLLPASDYEIHDTWYSTGLRGTGSNDVSVSDVFVPAEFSLAVDDVAGGPTPGSNRHGAVGFQLPVFALFPFVLAGCALGNAQACLDDYVARIRHQASTFSAARLAELQSLQIKVAEAGAKISAARRIMRGTCIEATQAAEAGTVPNMLERTRMRRDGAYSVNLCTEAVDLLFRASGASGLYVKHHLQRQFRDAHAINAHIAFSFDAAGSNNGRVELGLDNTNLTL